MNLRGRKAQIKQLVELTLMVQFFEVFYYVLPEVMLNVVWKEITRKLLSSCDKEPVKVIHENTIIFPQMKHEYAP